MKVSPLLRMLPLREYAGVNRDDPIRFYHWPVIGRLYRRRIEMCLAECHGGARVLEIGFGSGVTFLNLHDLYNEIYGLDLTASTQEVSAVFAARGITAHLQNGDVLQMPYDDCYFDTVLLISILEHLKPDRLVAAFQEIKRVLKPGGQVVYGVPVERPFMVFMFRLLGTNIRAHHFSTEHDVASAARAVLTPLRVLPLRSLMGQVYEVGHFVKQTGQA
jgi:ubiquinone/menaquinone biosynthesis C-methylase UbiE